MPEVGPKPCFRSVEDSACVDQACPTPPFPPRSKATPGTVGWFAGRVCKVTISGIPNGLNYSVVFVAYIYIYIYIFNKVGRNSAVGIATRYGLDGPEIE
jgi:hypothetical protein